MKKIYTLAIALFGVVAFAQTELIVNGGFEEWNDTNDFPTGYSPAPFTASVSKESTIVYDGDFSAKHQQTSGGSAIKIQQEVPVVAGNSYTISFRFLDNDPNARHRDWSFWLTDNEAGDGYTTLDNHKEELRGDAYSEDNEEWQTYSVTLTAPATATAFRLEVRTYNTGSGSGAIYYDNFSVIDNSTSSVRSNDISGLNIYPNPVTGNTLYVTSFNSVDKSVAIFDVLGKQVINTTTINGAVNVANLNAGVYIVKVTEEGKTATRKLVVK